MISGYQGQFAPSVSAVIAISQTDSAVIATSGFELCGLLIPAAFTGTALTFLVCDTASGTFVPLYNSAGLVSYTVAPSRYMAIDPKDFVGVAFFKIKSGSTEVAARTLICSLKGI